MAIPVGPQDLESLYNLTEGEENCREQQKEVWKGQFVRDADEEGGGGCCPLQAGIGESVCNEEESQEEVDGNARILGIYPMDLT